MPQLSIFPTDLGWFGLLGDAGVVQSLVIGHLDADEVRERFDRALRSRVVANAEESRVDEVDWHPALRRRLERYATGERDDFRDVTLAVRPRTDFQRQVERTVRRIDYGRTLTYGQVAAKAGADRAARAVGQVMATNPFPILIPCHRVVASNGGLGGFSAPQGITLKEQMLALEAEGVATAR